MTKLLMLAGHAGETFGHYWTAGKRSVRVGPGIGIYEGVFNREVCDYASDQEDDMIVLNPGPLAMTLDFKIQQVNKIVKQVRKDFDEDCILLSVHANAHGDGSKWNKAQGTTVFTPNKSTSQADYLAKLLVEEMAEQTPFKSRGIKKKKLKIFKANCPVVLLETSFMTNKKESAIMATEQGVALCGSAIWSAWLRYNDRLY